MAKRIQLRHFMTSEQVCAYMASELAETLDATLHRMTQKERQFYTDEDRKDMQNRIHDIQAYTKTLTSIPTLIRTAQEFISDIQAVGIPQTQVEWPDLIPTYKLALTALKGVPRMP